MVQLFNEVMTRVNIPSFQSQINECYSFVLLLIFILLHNFAVRRCGNRHPFLTSPSKRSVVSFFLFWYFTLNEDLCVLLKEVTFSSEQLDRTEERLDSIQTDLSKAEETLIQIEREERRCCPCCPFLPWNM